MSTPGAKAFVKAMSRQPLLEDDLPVSSDDQDALGVAARGLVLAVRGEPEEAFPLFESLTAGRSLAAFLGWNLLAFVLDESALLLEEGARIVRQQKDPLLRARLWCKLTTVALDRGQRNLAWNYLNQAAEITSRSSRLGVLIRVEAANEFGAYWDEIRPTPDTDVLADLPWISGAAEEAGREALIETVMSTSQRSSTMTVRFGPTVVDKIMAAEMQATWAGALWLRKPLRLQLAATLLSGGASSPAQWAYGCGMWVWGHGRNVSSVIAAAERHFDSDAGDALINRHLRFFGSGRWDSHTYSEVVGSVWDLISDETASRLVKSMPVTAAPDPIAAEQRAVLAALSLRAPKAWRTRFEAMSAEEKLAVATSLSPDVVERLPRQMSADLLKLLVSQPEQSQSAEGFYLVLAALLSKDAKSRGELRLDSAPDGVLADLVVRYPHLISDEQLDQTMRNLRSKVSDELTRAEHGTWGVGGRSARRDLGTLAGLTSSSRERSLAIGTLVKVVSSQRAPRDMRVEAALGLWPTSEKIGLTQDVIAQLRKAQTPSPMWNFAGGSSSQLLEVAILGAIAPNQLRQPEEDLLVALSRDLDPLVRRVAISAATMAGDLQIAEIAILAGLFDPHEDVLSATLDALRESYSRPGKSLRLPAVYQRLHDLFRSSGRDVRARVVNTSRTLARTRRRPQPLDAVLQGAKSDRSWIVRDATRGEARRLRSPG